MKISTGIYWLGILTKLFFEHGIIELLHFDWVVTRSRNKLLNILFSGGDGYHSCMTYRETMVVEYCQWGIVRRFRMFPDYSKGSTPEKWDFEYS